MLVTAPAGAQTEDPVDLANQAATDPAALDALRGISLEAAEALSGTDEDVAARVGTLASQDRYSVDEDATAIAQDILQQERFATARANTLGGLIEEWQRRFLVWLNRVIASILSNVPGGPRLFYGLLILGVLAASGVFAARLARNRIRVTEAATLARIRRDRGVSPAELQRRSRDAAAAGDYGEAVRLLFLAGLTVLDERDRIEFSPGTTTDEIAGQLESPAFERLAVRFNEIVYGGRPAARTDFESSRNEWDAMLEGAW